MLLYYPNLRDYMVNNGQRVGVMAIEDMTADLPALRDRKRPALDDRRLTDGEREGYYEPGGHRFHRPPGSIGIGGPEEWADGTPRTAGPGVPGPLHPDGRLP